LVRLIRQRWSIENGWHWPRDTQLQEDAYRYVHAGQQQRSHDIKGMLALGGDTSRDDYQPDHPDPWG
jgi:predicted transposase YbfD/YdcC